MQINLQRILFTTGAIGPRRDVSAT
jgi:hypothetical protein